MHKFLRAGWMFAVLCFATSLAAQPPAGQGPGPGSGPGSGPGAGPGPQGPSPFANAGPPVVHSLTPEVYWVQGAGGNTGFIIGDKSVTVIDTMVSESGAKGLLAAIAKVTPKPVTAVIVTHSDTDHVGGLGAFPAGITIYAQENTKKRLDADVASGHSRIPADHLPNRAVVDRENVVLGGVKMELLHWAPAHTDGDLVIYLPAQKIVFTGDIFVEDQPRALIHREKAGTSEGWITSAKGIVALNAEQYVVGHGDVQNKASLEKRLNVVIAEREQIKTLVAQGKSLAEVESAVGDPPPTQGDAQPAPRRFPPFSEVVYQELTEKK